MYNMHVAHIKTRFFIMKVHHPKEWQMLKYNVVNLQGNEIVNELNGKMYKKCGGSKLKPQ